MPKIVLIALIVLAAVAMRADAAWYYVSPSGDSENDGSITDPWDLESALTGSDGASVIAPGDTLWLRAGTYGAGGNTVFECTLEGTEGNPIVVRNYPDERATIDGGILAGTDAMWVYFYGLEVTNSETDRTLTRPSAFYVSHRGARIINCVIHDTGGPAVGFWGNVGDGGELYGNLVWANGWYNGAATVGQGFYMQNPSENDSRYVGDNMSFRNIKDGIKIWTQGGSSHGFTIEGNASFDNDLWNFLEHSNASPGKNNHLISNYTWQCDTDASINIEWGYGGDEEYNCRIENNYIVAGNSVAALKASLWNDLTVTGNTIVGLDNLTGFMEATSPIRAVWDRNTYYKGTTKPFDVEGTAHNWTYWRARTGFDAESTFTSASLPTGAKVFVRPNKYEPGRGHVIVYNWDEDEDVDVDVSTILQDGDSYEVLDAQNYYGTAVASGTYSGGTISLPMDLTTVASPVGGLPHMAWRFRHTNPVFGTFVVRRTSASLPRVFIERADDGAESGTDPMTYRVLRVGSTTSALTVNYSVTGGTAVAGDDYTVPSGSVEIAADDDSATFTITPVDDSASEALESVTVTLTADSAYEVDALQGAASAWIEDDDSVLEVHWKMDEGAGAYTYDSTDNLSPASTQWATWATGKFGSALSFNGSGQRVDCQATSICTMSTYTLAAWFKTTDDSGDRKDIYSERYGSNDYVRVYTQDGTIAFRHKNSSTMATASYSGDVNDGEWHHVAVVRDAAQSFTLYLDGEPVATDTTNNPPSVTRAYVASIGMYSNNGDAEYTYFNGTIDEVRVNSRALSATEIESLIDCPEVSIEAVDPTSHEFSGDTGTFRVTRTGATTSALTVNLSISGTATNGTDYATISSTVSIPSGYAYADVTVTPTNDTSAESDETVIVAISDDEAYVADTSAMRDTVTIVDDDTGMLVHWKMDEGSGSYTADATGNKSDGTFWGSWTTGKYSYCGSFAGSNQRVDVSPASIGALDTFTLSVWFKTGTTTGTRRDMYSERYSIWGRTRLMVNDGASGRLSFLHRDNSLTTASIEYDGSVCDDEWHHAVAVRRDSDLFELYLDGQLVGTDTENAPASYTPNAAWIAHYADNDGESTDFIGKVDDVRVYNYALTPEQIASLSDVVPATVSLSCAEDDQACESGPDTATFVVTRDSECIESALTVNYTVSGTAVNGTDYSTLSGSVTIAAGEDSATVTITPVDDAYNEDDETVTLTLAAGGYAIDEDAEADTATIADNEPVLLSHWKLDETSGYTGADSAGSNDLTVYGSWVTGIIDNGLELDGSNDRAYGSPCGIGNMDRYTVSAWFKTDNTGTSARDIYAENYSLFARVRIFVNAGAAGRVSFQHYDYTLDGAEMQYDAGANDDSWHHVAAVRDGVGSYKLYVDGTQVATDTSNAPGWSIADRMGVGYYNSPDGNTYFDGGLDDVRIYSGALSAFEVSLLAMENSNTISVDATDDSASETGPGTGTFTITRTGSTSGDLRVSYTLSGTATNGDDYTALQGAVVIESGQSSATVTVTPVDDAETESSETVTLTLDEGVYTVDSGNSSDTVTITDND